MMSLNALLDSQARSAGDEWIVLATVTHPTFSSPLRLASPRLQPLISNGLTFSPTRFDVVFPTEQMEEIQRSSVVYDGINGTILAALQGRKNPRPVITMELVLQSDPDEILFTAQGLEISSLQQDGVTRTIVELEGSKILYLPFPGINMDRTRMPGMFTDQG